MLYRRGEFDKALKEARAQCRARLSDGPGRVRLHPGRTPGRPGPSSRGRECRPGSGRVGFGSLHSPMILLLLGRKAEAVQASLQLRKNPAVVPNYYEGWYFKILDYQCDLISGEALLQAAGRCRPQLCEAHFLIGLSRLAVGDRPCRAHFHKCRETRVFCYWEYVWARPS